MHTRGWWIAVILMMVFSGGIVMADETGEGDGAAEPDPPSVTAGSVMVGGLLTLDTGYVVASGNYSQDQLSYYGDVIVDIGYPSWNDGSSGEYYHVGGSVGLRITALDGGRGLLAGVALGGGYSWLTVNDGGTASTVSDWQIGIVPQFGVRFGNESGIFGEAVMRLMLPLHGIFIYTDDTPPDTELGNPYSIFRYHAVYMPSGRPVGRLYLGVGYTFAN